MRRRVGWGSIPIPVFSISMETYSACDLTGGGGGSGRPRPAHPRDPRMSIILFHENNPIEFQNDFLCDMMIQTGGCLN